MTKPPERLRGLFLSSSVSVPADHGEIAVHESGGHRLVALQLSGVASLFQVSLHPGAHVVLDLLPSAVPVPVVQVLSRGEDLLAAPVVVLLAEGRSGDELDRPVPVLFLIDVEVGGRAADGRVRFEDAVQPFGESSYMTDPPGSFFATTLPLTTRLKISY